MILIFLLSLFLSWSITCRTGFTNLVKNSNNGNFILIYLFVAKAFVPFPHFFPYNMSDIVIFYFISIHKKGITSTILPWSLSSFPC